MQKYKRGRNTENELKTIDRLTSVEPIRVSFLHFLIADKIHNVGGDIFDHLCRARVECSIGIRGTVQNWKVARTEVYLHKPSLSVIAIFFALCLRLSHVALAIRWHFLFIVTQTDKNRQTQTHTNKHRQTQTNTHTHLFIKLRSLRYVLGLQFHVILSTEEADRTEIQISQD